MGSRGAHRRRGREIMIRVRVMRQIAISLLPVHSLACRSLLPLSGPLINASQEPIRFIQLMGPLEVSHGTGSCYPYELRYRKA